MDFAQKRADLQAQVEHLVGQINRNNGAIALLDDLIAERAQKEEPTAPAAASESPQWVQGPVLEMQPAQVQS